MCSIIDTILITNELLEAIMKQIFHSLITAFVRDINMFFVTQFGIHFLIFDDTPLCRDTQLGMHCFNLSDHLLILSQQTVQ